jgi:hypothetical protein
LIFTTTLSEGTGIHLDVSLDDTYGYTKDIRIDVSDYISKTQVDASFLRKTTDTFTGILQIDGSLIIGTYATNYTEIGKDGTLTLHGTATAWDDLRAPSQAINPAGSPSPATINNTDGTLTFAKGNVITCWFQMPHAWKEGSTIHPHIHWSKDVSASGNVNWQIKTKWSNIGEIMPAYGGLQMGIDYVSDASTAGMHALTEFPDMDASGKTFSSMLGVYLARINDASDNFTGNVTLYEVDIHYEIDSFGTSQEYVK